MRSQTVSVSQNNRIVAGLPFVEALARRMASIDAELDRHRRSRAGRRARPDRRRAPLRRRARHQVRDVRRAARARRDDRRAAQRRLAARRPPPAARARRGARSAAARAGPRAVDGRSGRARRLRREAPEPHDRPHQHDRSDVAARHRRAHGRELAADGARAVRAGFARHRLREAARRASACAPRFSRCRGASGR